MYKRKFGEATEDNGQCATSTSTSTSTSTTTNTNARNLKQQKQQRMVLIRNNATKNYLFMNKPQLVILCVVVLIGLWGFVGGWMAMEVTTVAHIDSNHQRGNGGSASMLRKQQQQQQHEMDRKEHEMDRKEHEIDLVGKEIIDASPFRLVSEGAPECYELESPDDITVTLVTQVSHDRLWMMKHHCDRYRNKQTGNPFDQHKMSVAVYSNATLDEIRAEMREMGCGVAAGEKKDANSNNNKRDQAPVDVSVLDARTHGAWNDFPVNELRNLAVSKVKTTHILYIDADFWPSDDLYETIMGSDESSGKGDKDQQTRNPSSQRIRKYLFDDPKLALVVPAFQLWRQCTEWEDCREDNLPHMEASRNFDGMTHEIVKHKSITVFDPTNKGGHGSTDYKNWFGQPPGSLVDIECLQSNRYEPFVMVRYCKDLPPFQTVFAGYGKNKVTWMMQVIASGYVFSQVGRAYLVHYPHLDSASRQLWNGRASKTTDSPTRKRDSKRGQVDKLFVDFKRWLEETIPTELQRLEACEDAQDDDSKLWVETRPSSLANG